MSLFTRVLESTLPYRLCQATHAQQKLVPLLDMNDLSRSHRVLDVGCGPGTNTAHFDNSEYVGLDLNLDYLRSARRRHRRPFIVADVTIDPLGHGDFDFILVNSLLHHLCDTDVHGVLRRLGDLLVPDGYIHILDLVLPPRGSLPRWMALLDRGDFARTLEDWREILEQHFECSLFQPYPLTVLGFTFWNMVYFRGAKRT
ncbi:MAG: class I SAM-dependent methyltransferase [Gammaproteobacteria bacterium]